MPTPSNNPPWGTLASLAALGTNVATAQSLDALWPDTSVAVPGETPAATLLRVAAARYLWELAGARTAATVVEPVEIAPPLEDKLISEPAAWRMARMLDGEHRDLLREWFDLASRSGRVLAPQWLPVALGSLRASEMHEATPVLGRRSIWLTRRNPAWQVPDQFSTPSEERWANGTVAERVSQLTLLRAADPGAARDWVEKTWEVDPPEAREAFIRAFLNGLSPADERFLETALRDKRKTVRVGAIECLVRLPASAYTLRNIERVNQLLTFDPPATGLLSRLKTHRLHVTLPTTLDKPAARDGIEQNPPASRKMGERAWWLVQMVSLVQPSHWTTRFECDVETLIEAVADTEYSSELLWALSQAATRHCDESWLMMLLRHFLARRLAKEASDEADSTIVQLISAAPAAIREKLLAEALVLVNEGSFSFALTLLNGSDADWSSDTTHRAFELLGQRVRAESQQYAFPRNTLVEWGRRADVQTALVEIERLDARCPSPSPWRNAIEALKEIIEFRSAMRQELLT